MDNKTPRMRTIPKAYAELKKIDPETDFTLRALRRMVKNFTLRALRRMVKNNEIPCINVANKKLINLDMLLEILSCDGYNQYEPRTSE